MMAAPATAPGSCFEYTPVASSQIAAFGYDPVRQVLRVAFNTRAEYEYEGVGPDVHMALLRAESKGRMFNTLVKAAGYPFVKLESSEYFATPDLVVMRRALDLIARTSTDPEAKQTAEKALAQVFPPRSDDRNKPVEVGA